MEKLTLHSVERSIDALNFNLEHSSFVKGSLRNSRLENIMMAGTTIHDVDGSRMKISNANLTELEIEGAQLGGAYIHNIGMPPKDHPMYVAGSQMRPLRFEDCALTGSQWTDCNMSEVVIDDCTLRGASITNCNLSGVELKDCNIQGMTINGVSVEELLNRR